MLRATSQLILLFFCSSFFLLSCNTDTLCSLRSPHSCHHISIYTVALQHQRYHIPPPYPSSVSKGKKRKCQDAEQAAHYTIVMTETASIHANGAYSSLSNSAQRILPVASTVVSEATGFAALSESYPSSTTRPSHKDAPSPALQPSSSSVSEQSHAEKQEQQQEQEKVEVIAREDVSEELERGPSQPERCSQPQQHIGTESGIPTTAGAGTTLSPDDDVQKAYQKEQQNRRSPSCAAVGVDYSDQPCPTADARRQAPSSYPAQGKTVFESTEEQLHGSEHFANTSNSSSNGNSNSSEDERRTEANTESSAAASEQPEGGREGGDGASLKSKLKGSAKVFTGKITGNEDKVEAGKMLKAGITPA